MIRQWLGDTPLASFVEHQLGHRPFASPGIDGVDELLSWDRLLELLAGASDLDALVVAFGTAHDERTPRDHDGLRNLFRRGLGLVIRRAERSDALLQQLASSFEQDLGGAATIQLFATPAGTHGFGWHYDFEDVFIVQTAGIKTYFLRPNTVARDTPIGPRPDFGAIARESSPVHEARLHPGDWLYVPARWWHIAMCEADALSVSIGVLGSQRPRPAA